MKLSPKAQAALGRVIEQFKSGDLSPVIEIATLQRQGEPVPFDAWSFGNQVLAYIQSGSTDLRGYRQWQAVDRQVQKGSQAAFILAPCTRKTDDDSEEKIILVGFKAIAVFAYHDTEGAPLPDHDYTPRQPPPLTDVAQALGISVEYSPLPPDRLGDHRPGQIRLATHDESTFFHELAHAAHTHIDGPKRKQGQDPTRETIAEFTATVLMQLYGLRDHSGNAWKYIAHYNKDPLRAIQQALAKIEQVLILIERGAYNANATN